MQIFFQKSYRNVNLQALNTFALDSSSVIFALKSVQSVHTILQIRIHFLLGEKVVLFDFLIQSNLYQKKDCVLG